MPRPLRVFDDSNAIFFVTNRCFQGRMFLRPSDESDAIILGYLARSVKKYQVELFCFVFMSNHFHFLMRAPKQNLNLFMAHFQSNLAKQLNAHCSSGCADATNVLCSRKELA